MNSNNGNNILHVAFVVLNYNDAETTTLLVDQLCSWHNPKLDLHIIVVDNRSSDDSFNVLSERYILSRRVSVLLTERNGGYSYGNNYGSKYAIKNFASEYIAIANPDITVEEDTVINLIDTFNIDSSVKLCAPVMKALNGSYRICSQTLPTWVDDLKACRLRNHSQTLHDTGYRTLDDEGIMILTEMVPGSFFVIRSSCLQEIGFLDENVFLYCEERILGKKLKDAGYKAVVRSDLFYIHAHAVTTSKSISLLNREKLMLNSRYYYQKEYCRCNIVQLLLLKTAMKRYLLELKTVLLIRR